MRPWLTITLWALVACAPGGGDPQRAPTVASSTTGHAEPPGSTGEQPIGTSEGSSGESPSEESSTGGSTGDTPAEAVEWPNAWSQANSDPWLAEHHDEIEVMRPRFLVINFANGVGVGGNDEMLPDSRFTEAQLRAKAEDFLTILREGSRHHASSNDDARPFVQPEIAKIVDLSDAGDHANAAAFPRGQTIPATPGYQTVGYYALFSEAYADAWGYADDDGTPLTLGEIVERGLVHEVIMIANQVDGREPNPPDQVTSNILEVAMVAQAYDDELRPRPGEFVKNGTPFERQKEDMAQATAADHNSMPWTGRSLRIYFMNASRGAGCLAHSLGHEFEFRYTEARVYSPATAAHGAPVNPYLQPDFRRYAGFDYDARHGAPFSSLYAGGNDYSYEDCDRQGVCETLRHPAGTISPYRTACGNVHYPPGAAEGYDYEPSDAVLSFCESFGQAAEAASPMSSEAWAHLTADPTIDGDCGGKFLTYWFQNMPGLGNRAFGADGRPAKNWWVFMYY